MTVNSAAPLEVVAAVVSNPAGEILLARRAEDKHQGGLWEFPGGKREPGETPEQALVRELEEEVNIRPTQYRPLIKFRYDYPDKSVLLDVWRVEGFTGEARGNEGQPIGWVPVNRLTDYDFPAANRPIIVAASLPDRYMVTPEPDPDDLPAYLDQLERALQSGIRLVQYRAKQLSRQQWQSHASAVIKLCERYAASCILNTDVDAAVSLSAHGVHLNSQRLFSYRSRPVDTDIWLVASCHNLADLQQAQTIGADFVVLSPVKATDSHPDTTPLGWQVFRDMVKDVAMPVYALGGMHVDDIDAAIAAGGQGIAAIRSLWR